MERTPKTRHAFGGLAPEHAFGAEIDGRVRIQM
jgi:hypothetical protein